MIQRAEININHPMGPFKKQHAALTANPPDYNSFAEKCESGLSITHYQRKISHFVLGRNPTFHFKLYFAD
jgi:hypothetical protein